MRQPAAAFFTVFLNSVAFAAVPIPQNEKVLLKWNLEPNQRFEYMVKMNINGGETLGTLDGTVHFAERVIAKTDKGFDQSVYCAGLSLRGTGVLDQAKSSIEEIRNQSYKRSIGFNGKSLSVAGLSSALIGSSVDLVFSDKPVGVGDSWVDRFKPNDALGEAKVTYTLSTLTADEAVVMATVTPTETLRTKAPYVFVVDRKTGRYKQAKGAIIATLMGNEVNINFEMQMLIPVQPMPWGNRSDAKNGGN